MKKHNLWEKIKKAKRDPEFRKALKEFIKKSTS